jgi:trimeric autotransporter adhesin
MNRTLCVMLVSICLVLTGALAQAAVTVYPNPVQFGTVAVNSTGYEVGVYLTNTTATAVTISSITISGTNSANFAFGPWTCVGTISGNQSCQMYMTFTPLVMGNISASLVVSVSGVTTPITIPLQGTGGNPIPNITSISPPSVYVNTPTTTVTINGAGFLPSSLVYLQNYPNGTALPTTYVSATKITTQVPDTALSNLGAVSLYVANPQPGGGTSITANLQIVGGEPSISNINPASIVAGTASEPIIINGQNFASGAAVQWNGVNVPTTYLSSTQLQAQPTTAELGSPAMIQLTVTNPSPGTVSQFVNFDVTAPITITVLDLPANDLVWDPFAQVLYASLPSSYGVNGNSVAVINPSTGAITGYHFAGSEPDALALDSTSKNLYVGLNGSNSVQQLALPLFTHGVNIGLGKNSSGTPNIAEAIAVSPANVQTIAVETGANGCCCCGTLDFFTGSTKLANSNITSPMNQLVFANGTTLYGYTSGTLSQVNVTTTGGTLGQTWTDIVNGSTISYSGGLIFGGNGQEFNPSTGLLLGTFDTGNNTCCNNNGPQILSNSSLNRAFVLGQTPFFNSLGITSYNLTQFTPKAVADLSELSPQFSSSTVSKFIQWSTNGMAFILSPNSCCGNTTTQVVLVQSPTLMLTVTKTASPVPVGSSLSPATVTHGTGNFRMSVRGSGFVPGSIVTWNGKRISASYVSATQMTVYVTKATIASSGIATVTVKNPAPGGGTSNSLTFTIK